MDSHVTFLAPREELLTKLRIDAEKLLEDARATGSRKDVVSYEAELRKVKKLFSRYRLDWPNAQP